MAFNNYEEFEEFGSRPGVMARMEQATADTSVMFVHLMTLAFAVKHSVEHDNMDAAVEGSNLMARAINSLDQEHALTLIAFMLDQMVEQIHDRLAPDGSLDELHARMKEGVSPFVGTLSDCFLKEAP